MSELTDSAAGQQRLPRIPVTQYRRAGWSPPRCSVPVRRPTGPTAYEVKFLLTEVQGAAVEARVAGKLALDPYADPRWATRTSRPACTPTRRLRRVLPHGGIQPRQVRVRRYGVSGPVFRGAETKNGRQGAEAPGANQPGGGDRTRRVEAQRRVGRRVVPQPVDREATAARVPRGLRAVAYLGVADGGTVRSHLRPQRARVLAASGNSKPWAGCRHVGRVVASSSSARQMRRCSRVSSRTSH